MARWECSILADKLQAYINRQKAQLERLADKPKVYKKVQDDIMTLEEVMTYVQAETNLFNMVVIDLIGKALIQAEQEGCNDIILCIPLKNTYKDRPKIGVFNPTIKIPVVYSEDEYNNICIHNIRYTANNIGEGDTEPDIIHLNNVTGDGRDRE